MRPHLMILGGANGTASCVCSCADAGATGAWADRDEDCGQDEDPDRKIRGCTQIIERGKRESKSTRASAYYNRGLPYAKKDDKAHAIADFRKALEIDPSAQKAKDALKRLGVTP